jgi:tetratricopeptide (TPR) repeat protein
VQPPPLDQAEAALNANRAAEVRPSLESAASQDSRNPLIWALLARAYLQLQDPAKARAAAAKAEPLAAQDPRAQHALALFHAQAGDRKRAAEFERLYALSPQADRAAPARAVMLSAETGLFEACAELGERAIQGTDRPEVRQAVELCYQRWTGELLRTARFTAAANLLESGAKLFPANAQLALNLGVAYYAQRRFEDAIGQFLRVTELDATIPQPYWFLSRMLDQLGPRLSDAARRFAAWNAKEQQHHWAPLVHAKAIVAMGGDLGEAARWFEESIRRKGDDAESRFEYGLLLEQQGQLREAAVQLETSLKLDAEQAAAYYRLARIQERLGNPARAAELRQLHQQKLAAGKKAGMR